LKAEEQCGSIEIGKSADFNLLNTNSYTDLVYHFGVNHIAKTWCKGIAIQ